MSDDPNWLAPQGQPWQVTTSTRFHDNPWFAADDFDAVAPTGVPAKYYLLHFKNWAVGVIPLHADGTISLVGQWRFPFRDYSWELPEGGQPRGEAPLDGAKRELREEAGVEAANWRLILNMQLSNASSDEQAFLYLATDLTPVPVDPDATEELAQVRVPFREALAAATTGKIKDALTVAALLRLYHMAQEGELSDALTRLVLG
jgi:8-oxo-dGTP pyrophosphatase MutT (NUDIX family)